MVTANVVISDLDIWCASICLVIRKPIWICSVAPEKGSISSVIS